MYVLLHQFQELVRGCVDGSVGKKLLDGVGNQRKWSTEVVGNIGEEDQLGMGSGFQLAGQLLQLRGLQYQLLFLLLQLLLLARQFTVQPVLGAQGEVDGNQ